MKKLIFLSILIIPNLVFGQKIFFGYGTEINFARANFTGTISNSYLGENYSYEIDANELVTNLSWSSMKIGYLTKNNIYFGLHGSFISPLLEEGKVIKENLWKKRIDISDSVYGNGSITYEAQASFKYKRFIGLDLGYDVSKLLVPNDNIILISGLGIYYHNIYFGETIETFRYQYYASGSQSDLYYTENGKYKDYSKIGLSFKLIAMFKYIYLETSIGQVNSLGLGFMYSY